MSNWRSFTLDFGIPSRDRPNGHPSAHTAALDEVLAEINLCDTSNEAQADRLESLKRAGCDVERLQSMRARKALLEGATPGTGSWRLAPKPAPLVRMLIRDLLRSDIAPDNIEAVLRVSACAHLVGGHWERVAPVVAACNQELAREAAKATWRNPPTARGTDDMLLRAVVGLTRERGMWCVAPAERACEDLARWVQDQGLPLPPDWPHSGRSIGFALRRIRERLTVAGVWWKKGRIGARESNGARPCVYVFIPWGYGGKQDSAPGKAA